MTCRIALNVGSIVCSCVLTQKGTSLKAIVDNLLNLSNRNSYRHSLVFFVSDLVLNIQCDSGEKVKILRSDSISYCEQKVHMSMFLILNAYGDRSM
jgi:hypothetical protein